VKQPGLRAVPIGVYDHPPPLGDPDHINAVQLRHGGSLPDPIGDAGIQALEQTTRLNDWLNRRAQDIIDAL
jgi:hypothetical protein